MTAKIFGTGRKDALLTTLGEYGDMLAVLAEARKPKEED